MRPRFLVPLIVVFAALAPSTAGAATLHGVVVARQHGLLLVATPSGLVQTVRGTAAIGSRLDGTRVVGHAATARLHGIVVKRIGTTMFLSSNHHLLAVHTGRTLANLSPTPGQSITGAQPGSVVNTTVGIQQSGELDEQSENEVGQVSGNVQVQATVTAVGAGTVTLSVNGQSVTVDLPAGLTLPSSVVGQTVTIGVSLGNGSQGGGDGQGDDGGGGGGDD